MTNDTASWKHFLCEWIMLRDHYAVPTALTGTGRNPALDHVVPGLLLIKAVAVLHEFMRNEVTARALDLPRKYRGTFEDDINLLAKAGPLQAQRVGLHKVRDRRNDVAHQHATISGWSELQPDIELLDESARALGIDTDLPTRLTVEVPNDAICGAIFTRLEVVDFVLDFVDYTEDKPLHERRLLENNRLEDDNEENYACLFKELSGELFIDLLQRHVKAYYFD